MISGERAVGQLPQSREGPSGQSTISASSGGQGQRRRRHRMFPGMAAPATTSQVPSPGWGGIVEPGVLTPGMGGHDVAGSQPRMGRYRRARRVNAGNFECVITSVFFELEGRHPRAPRHTRCRPVGALVGRGMRKSLACHSPRLTPRAI